MEVPTALTHPVWNPKRDAKRLVPAERGRKPLCRKTRKQFYGYTSATRLRPQIVDPLPLSNTSSCPLSLQQRALKNKTGPTPISILVVSDDFAPLMKCSGFAYTAWTAVSLLATFAAADVDPIVIKVRGRVRSAPSCINIHGPVIVDKSISLGY